MNSVIFIGIINLNKNLIRGQMWHLLNMRRRRRLRCPRVGGRLRCSRKSRCGWRPRITRGYWRRRHRDPPASVLGEQPERRRRRLKVVSRRHHGRRRLRRKPLLDAERSRGHHGGECLLRLQVHQGSRFGLWRVVDRCSALRN